MRRTKLINRHCSRTLNVCPWSDILYKLGAYLVVLVGCFLYSHALSAQSPRPETGLAEENRVSAIPKNSQERSDGQGSHAPIVVESLPVSKKTADDEPARSPREYIGQKYLGFIAKSDNFFSGRRLEQDNNDSFLKAEFLATGFERSASESDLRLRAKIDLPGTKRRLKLFLDSDLDQDQGLDSRGRGVASGRNVDEQNTSAGLEFFRSPDSKFKKSMQVGARTGSSLRPFIRLRLRNAWKLGRHWRLGFRQDFWHLDDVGFGETTRVEFSRSIAETFNLRVLTEVEYRDEPEPLLYLHEWVLGQRLSEGSALIYRAGGIGEVKREKFAKEQFLAVTYRSVIYKDWAYINLTPRLIFSDNSPWKHEGAFSIRLEMFFTD